MSDAPLHVYRKPGIRSAHLIRYRQVLAPARHQEVAIHQNAWEGFFIVRGERQLLGLGRTESGTQMEEMGRCEEWSSPEQKNKDSGLPVCRRKEQGAEGVFLRIS